MQRVLRELPPEQRQVLLMAFFGGLSHSELASKLGQPLGTVKSRIARARENLRLLLTETHPDLKPALSVADFFLTARAVYGQPAISYA